MPHPLFDPVWSEFVEHHGYEPIRSTSFDWCAVDRPDEGGWIQRFQASASSFSEAVTLIFQAVVDDPTSLSFSITESTGMRGLAARLGFAQDVLVGNPDFDSRFVVRANRPKVLLNVCHDVFGDWAGLPGRIELRLVPGGDGPAGHLPPGLSTCTLQAAGVPSQQWLTLLHDRYRSVVSELWSLNADPEGISTRILNLPAGSVTRDEQVIWDARRVRRRLLEQAGKEPAPELIPALARVCRRGSDAEALSALRVLDRIDHPDVAPAVLESMHRGWSHGDHVFAERAAQVLRARDAGPWVRTLEDTLSGDPQHAGDALLPAFQKALTQILEHSDDPELEAAAAAGLALNGATDALGLIRRRAYRVSRVERPVAGQLRRAVLTLERQLIPGGPPPGPEQPRPADINAELRHRWQRTVERVRLRDLPRPKPEVLRAVREIWHDECPYTLVVDVWAQRAVRLSQVPVHATLRVVFYNARGASLAVAGGDTVPVPSLRSRYLLDGAFVTEAGHLPESLETHLKQLVPWADGLELTIGRFEDQMGARMPEQLDTLMLRVTGALDQFRFIDAGVEAVTGLLPAVAGAATTAAVLAARFRNVPGQELEEQGCRWWRGSEIREILLERLAKLDDPVADETLLDAMLDRHPGIRATARELFDPERHGPRLGARAFRLFVRSTTGRDDRELRSLVRLCGWGDVERAWIGCLNHGRPGVPLSARKRSALIEALRQIIAERRLAPDSNAGLALAELERLDSLPRPGGREQQSADLPRSATGPEPDAERLPRSAELDED